jgi:hypothetical protein
MKTLCSLNVTLDWVSRKSLMLAWFGGLVLTLAANAAPIQFLQGGVTLTVRPDPNHPSILFSRKPDVSGMLFADNTVGNELIFILTNASNVPAYITNPCQGTTLAVNDVCAFSVLFDTGDVSADFWKRGQIRNSVQIRYATQDTNGVPLPTRRETAGITHVVVVDGNISSFDPAPEPVSFVLIGGGLIGLALVGRRRTKPATQS